MTEVKIKRVYDPEGETDGYRVLVDKLWPRGVKKENLHYDLWAKDITPSTPLREWFHEDQEGHWPEFARKYAEELEKSQAVDDFIERVKNERTITLLYASRNATENHALVLQKFLQKRLG